MKIIFTSIAALIATLTFAAGAQAMVQPPGTFVPVKCGAQQYQSGNNLDIQGTRNITEVCVGTIAGEALGTKAVQFRLNDATTRVFNVSSTATLLVSMVSANFKAMFYLVGPAGERTTMKVIENEGQVESAAGSLEGIRYFVPKFETVFVVQNQGI